MQLILKLLHVTVADEILAQSRFFISSKVILNLQMVKPLSCMCDPFTFLLTTSRVLAKEITSARGVGEPVPDGY